MTGNYHGLAKVLRNNGIQPRVHPLMKLGDGLATWEKLGVGIAAPIWGAMTSNKFRKGKPIAFGAWVVLAESSVDVDGQAGKGGRNNLSGFPRSRIATRIQHIALQFLCVC